MRIIIFGAGAVGGVLAARFVAAGENVALVARGPHVEAIRSAGLRFSGADGERAIQLPAADDAAALGPADLVISTVKAHDLPRAAGQLAQALAPGGRLIVAVNGIPWWFFHGFGGVHEGRPIPCLDPDGALRREIDLSRLIGAVLYTRSEVLAPGHVHHYGGERIVLGAPAPGESQELVAMAAVLWRAGWAVETTGRIRDAIFEKLQGNAAFNPINALVGGGMADMVADPGLLDLAARIMTEVEAIGRAYGVRFAKSVPERLGAAKGFGAFKTSMLQDLERGKPLEIDAILGATVELAKLADVSTPALATLLALLRAKIGLRTAFHHR